MPQTGPNITAIGTTLGGAYQIPSGQDLTVVTTCGSGAGVNLPSTGVSLGEEYVVANHGSNACLVYPGTANGKMGTAGGGAGYSLAAGKAGYFVYCGSMQWTTNP
jgi:hypothetical protein